jgi:Flp pilus assembly protein TadG
MSGTAAAPARWRRERGQILVIVAGGLIGLLAFAGLALEGGTLVLNRRDAQNASDLAAVAGAQVIATGYTDVGVSVTQGTVLGALSASMAANDCSTLAPCTWTAEFVGTRLASLGPVGSGGSIPGGSLGVRVQVTRTPGALLGRMLGFTTWKVSTEGTAIATKPSSMGAGTMLPIAMCGWTNTTSNDCVRARNSPSNAIDLQPGQIYDLAAGKDAPGGFGWVSWSGSGGSLSTSICTPNNPALNLDSPYDGPTGGSEVWFRGAAASTTVAEVSSCLHQWIANRATVLIPIYDVLDDDGRYHITGAAAFVLTSLGPAEDIIQGYFVEYVPFSGVPDAGGTRPPDVSDTTVFLGLVK